MSYFIVNMLFNVPVEKDIKSFYIGGEESTYMVMVNVKMLAPFGALLSY